jgi:hypothetical protein
MGAIPGSTNTRNGIMKKRTSATCANTSFRGEGVVAIIAVLIAGLIGFLIGKESSKAPAQHATNRTSEPSLNPAVKRDLPRTTRPPFSRTPIVPVRLPSGVEVMGDQALSQEELDAFAAWSKESQQQAVEEMIARTAAESAEDYFTRLSGFGLDPEEIQQLQSELTELHRKAIAAGDPLQELVLARNDYDQSLRSLLSEDDYQRYREYEARKPAVREYDLLAEHATRHGLSLDPAEADRIIGLIQDAGATTTETWHGPYDPPPSPIAGEAAIEKMRQDYTALVDKANSLVEAATESGLPSEYIQLFVDYYTEKTQKTYDLRKFFNRPIEEVVGDIRASTREAMAEQLPQTP